MSRIPLPDLTSFQNRNLSNLTNLTASGVFAAALVIYVLTLAPGLLWGGGDFATFQTRLYTGEIEISVFGHPLWVIVAHPFVWLPIRDVAYRANLAAAVFAAAALAFVFLSAWRITRSVGASLLATATLMVSHTFWTYAVMPKPYSLNALLLSACIYFALRWGQETRALDLAILALLYAISPMNHLVMLTAIGGFAVYLVLIARRYWTKRSVRLQILAATAIYLIVFAFCLLLVVGGGNVHPVGGTIISFLTGFFTVLVTPSWLLLGLATGMALLIYQFPLMLPVGIFGLVQSWRGDRAVAALLVLIALGDAAFLMGATDPRTGGEYVWNLHYYLQVYIVFALWIAVGSAMLLRQFVQNRWQRIVAAAACIGMPIILYAISPVVARPFLANLPGFRQVGSRDNLTYVLSPWKQNETGARVFGESILDALPPNSILFADYSIWAVVNYLQVVEHARPDVRALQLPGTGTGQQLPMILNELGKGDLFLGDANRYYDMSEIQMYFDLVPVGSIYHLIAK